jgi:hypothetical protein
MTSFPGFAGQSLSPNKIMVLLDQLLAMEDLASVLFGRHLDLFERKRLCGVSRAVRQSVLRYNKDYGSKVKIGMVFLDSNLTFSRVDEKTPMMMRQEAMNMEVCTVEPVPNPSAGQSHSRREYRTIYPKMRLSSSAAGSKPRDNTLFRKSRRQFYYGSHVEHVKMTDLDHWPSIWAAFPGGFVHSRMRQVMNMYRLERKDEKGFAFYAVTDAIALPRPKVLSPVTAYDEVYPLWADDFQTSLWVDSLQMLFLAGGTNTNLIQVHVYDQETKTFPRRFHLPFFAPIPETGMTLAFDERTKRLYVVGGIENMRKTRKISWIDLTDIRSQIPDTQEDIDAVASRVTESWMRVDQHAAMHVGVQLVTCPWSSIFFQMKYPRGEPIVKFLDGYLVVLGGQTPNGLGGGRSVVEFIHQENGTQHHVLFNCPALALFTN